MKFEIHALRFCEDDAERAKRRPFNNNPAVVKIEPGSEVVIKAKDDRVSVTIDGVDTNPVIFLGPWDFTAVALVVDEIPEQ